MRKQEHKQKNVRRKEAWSFDKKKKEKFGLRWSLLKKKKLVLFCFRSRKAEITPLFFSNEKTRAHTTAKKLLLVLCSQLCICLLRRFGYILYWFFFFLCGAVIKDTHTQTYNYSNRRIQECHNPVAFLLCFALLFYILFFFFSNEDICA